MEGLKGLERLIVDEKGNWVDTKGKVITGMRPIGDACWAYNSSTEGETVNPESMLADRIRMQESFQKILPGYRFIPQADGIEPNTYMVVCLKSKPIPISKEVKRTYWEVGYLFVRIG